MNLYPQNSSQIDLREEFAAVLYGRVDIVGQGRQFILRRLSNTPCACWDALNGSPDPNCPFCNGEGYQFSETIETMYLSGGAPPLFKGGFLGTGNFPQEAYGYGDPSKGIAFCEYTVFPDYERYIEQDQKKMDKLFELKVDPDGQTAYPQVKTAKWKVVDLTPMHGDHGRIEYFILALSKEYAG